jgi:hypothetical protein
MSMNSAIARALDWLSEHWLKPPRIIWDGEGNEPYLSRYYLLGRPRMPDGSEPFDEFGNTRAGAVTRGRFALYLHRFHKGDVDRELHNHPWRWAVSLVLSGGYVEERRRVIRTDIGRVYDGRKIVQRYVLPGHFNVIRGGDFHRVDLLDNGVTWSLFLTGARVTDWAFWDRHTGEVTPWREFLARKQNGGGVLLRAVRTEQSRRSLWGSP